MLSKKNHSYHIVDMSPWPILSAIALLVVVGGGVMAIHKKFGGDIIFILGITLIMLCLWRWCRDIVNEGLVGQHHSKQVQHGLRIGMMLFILSETILFLVFFVVYLKYSIFPSGILNGLWVADGTWTSQGIQKIDPWDIPFINTLILLLSGTTVTWAHHAIQHNHQQDTVNSLGLTVLLGMIFSFIQVYEYYSASFKITDGVYASNFYLITGFHGVHVIIGTIFLAVCYVRAKKRHFTAGNGYLGFEFAAWYWHFIDVVWLLIFVFLYVLGR